MTQPGHPYLVSEIKALAIDLKVQHHSKAIRTGLLLACQLKGARWYINQNIKDYNNH